MGKPSPDFCEKIAQRMKPLFPHKDAIDSRELLSLFVFLDSKTILAKAVPLLATVQDSNITLTSVADADITDRKPYPVSLMPPGLLNDLNPEELFDLQAYLLSSGKPDATRFK